MLDCPIQERSWSDPFTILDCSGIVNGSLKDRSGITFYNPGALADCTIQHISGIVAGLSNPRALRDCCRSAPGLLLKRSGITVGALRDYFWSAPGLLLERSGIVAGALRDCCWSACERSRMGGVCVCVRYVCVHVRRVCVCMCVCVCVGQQQETTSLLVMVKLYQTTRLAIRQLHIRYRAQGRAVLRNGFCNLLS